MAAIRSPSSAAETPPGRRHCFLARHTKPVRLLVRGEDLAASMSRYLADRIDQTAEIEVLLHTEIAELIGERRSSPWSSRTTAPASAA